MKITRFIIRMYEENIPVNIQKILLKEYLILIKNT
jgi:hypothetical protein